MNQNWPLNHAPNVPSVPQQQGNVQGQTQPSLTDQRLAALEHWKNVGMVPWGNSADNQFQELYQQKLAVDDYRRERDNRVKRIENLEEFQNHSRHRIDKLEGRMGKVEQQAQENGNAVNENGKAINENVKAIKEVAKTMSKNQKYLIKEIGKLPDKLGQPYGGGDERARRFGGRGEGLNCYEGGGGERVSTGDQFVTQHGFINMINQQQIQQQQQLFPAIPWGGYTPLPPAPAPTCRYCVYRPCIHVDLRYKSSSKKKW
jgi:hypothetical protein